jgi:NADPH:quinone reductase-like Zn-dependent oxidoreductase
MYQKMIPIQFPFTMGGDFTGKIVAVGDSTSDYKIGDEVYGQAIVLNGGSGTMAEFVAANTKNTALKPQKATWEEAGALPLIGTSALQALSDHMHVQSGQKILIHGGAGGIGHIAIQIAKAMGAYVATTVKLADTEFVKGLGADEVIDYKTQKFEEILKDYDAVYDTVGGETTDKSFTVLKKGGVLVSMVGQPNEKLAKQYEVTSIGQMTHTTTSHLQKLAEFVDNGKVTVRIDKTFAFEKVQEAFSYQEKNHPQGKVIIVIKE